MAIDVSYLEHYLFEHIPISQALGVKVVIASPTRVVLGAPIAANINHKKTVFGGSLHALATLTCWSLAFINLNDLGVEIVIHSSDIQYLRPVTQDFLVECVFDTPEAWVKFKKMLERKGMARIELKANIYQDNELAVAYRGEFVAIRS